MSCLTRHLVFLRVLCLGAQPLEEQRASVGSGIGVKPHSLLCAIPLPSGVTQGVLLGEYHNRWSGVLFPVACCGSTSAVELEKCTSQGGSCGYSAMPRDQCEEGLRRLGPLRVPPCAATAGAAADGSLAVVRSCWLRSAPSGLAPPGCALHDLERRLPLALFLRAAGQGASHLGWLSSWHAARCSWTWGGPARWLSSAEHSILVKDELEGR